MLTFIQTISIYAKNHFSSESSRYHKTIFVQTTKKKKKKKDTKSRKRVAIYLFSILWTVYV